MNKKLIYIIVGVIIIGGGGLGAYYYFNPLGGGNDNLAPGTIISDGEFVAIDSAHYGSGTAQFVQIDENSVELQFVDVDIANGPDLFVYLSSKSSFSGTDDATGTILDLGELSYNSGSFAYELPSGTPLDDYHSVLIFCKQFSVVFTYASLTPSA